MYRRGRLRRRHSPSFFVVTVFSVHSVLLPPEWQSQTQRTHSAIILVWLSYLSRWLVMVVVVVVVILCLKWCRMFASSRYSVSYYYYSDTPHWCFFHWQPQTRLWKKAQTLTRSRIIHTYSAPVD
jgi:hypothetical protein